VISGRICAPHTAPFITKSRRSAPSRLITAASKPPAWCAMRCRPRPRITRKPGQRQRRPRRPRRDRRPKGRPRAPRFAREEPRAERERLGRGLAAVAEEKRLTPDRGLQLGRRAFDDDPTLIDDPDPVTESVGLFHVVGRQHDCHPERLVETFQRLPNRDATARIEALRRLVEEEDRRNVNERGREIDAPLHPSRVSADALVGRMLQVDQTEAGREQPGRLFAARAL
jgi:hypothetical protein